jgi:hypothetical protein
MAQLYLDSGQLSTLGETLRESIRQLTFEIARTDDREFRRSLTARWERLEDLRIAVETASPRTGPVQRESFVL